MRQVSYSRDAIKTLRRIDRKTADRIESKMARYAAEPASLANNVKALKGYEGLKRLRIGDWRAIFTEDLVVVDVVKVAPRGGVYD